jgi:hypothetical protein
MQLEFIFGQAGDEKSDHRTCLDFETINHEPMTGRDQFFFANIRHAQQVRKFAANVQRAWGEME